MHNLASLLGIMRRLRDPEQGCDWDLAQTYETIVPHTIEEAYEVADAIERQDFQSLRDELGDLLFQIIFYSQLSQERSTFNFDDVVQGICEKMIRRHPHIFEMSEPVLNSQKTNRSWEVIKAEERVGRRDNSQRETEISVLDGIAKTLPSLFAALKLQQRAALAGFDWPEIKPVVDKIAEELEELRTEIDEDGSSGKIEEELGDLLFACVNLARHLNINAEMALRNANRKFERRFRRVEALMGSLARDENKISLETMQTFWEQAKLEEGA